MEAHPGIQATGLHATVDLEIRDEAIALASIPHPSLANYANVLDERQRREERIMDDADLAGPLLFIICFGTFLLLVRDFGTRLPFLHP